MAVFPLREADLCERGIEFLWDSFFLFSPFSVIFVVAKWKDMFIVVKCIIGNLVPWKIHPRV